MLHDILHCVFFARRQGANFPSGDPGSVHCGVHSQLCGSDPAFSGALCSCTAQTQVLSPQQVRATLSGLASLSSLHFS